MSSAIARLNDFGQSPWYDNLARPLLTGGGLAKLVEVDGIRGVTSNPTILDKAIGAGEGYDEQLAACAQQGLSIEDTYWDVVLDDIVAATDVLRPVFDAHDGGDGFVSVEVAPTLAHDTDGHDRRGALAARAGRPAQRDDQDPRDARGHPRDRGDDRRGDHRQRHAHLLARPSRQGDRGVPHRARAAASTAGGDPSTVASVASFFVSRVDTETDRRLPEGSPLRGKAAVANAKLAYELFRAPLLGCPVGRARGQGRPAAAPAVGVDVDQEPGVLVDALRRRADRARHRQHPGAGVDRGAAARRGQPACRTPWPRASTQSHQVMADLAAAGVDIDDVTDTLEREGVDSFAASFTDAFGTIEKRRAEVTG